ncbi:MAG: hypothetical protein AB2L21_09255 [Anaerolineaceae bacterium]|jgi:tetratricopeptide (TPR) repeat protein
MENDTEENMNEVQKPQEPTMQEMANSESPEVPEATDIQADLKLPKKRKPAWVWRGILFIIVALILGAWTGYQNGIQRRLNLEKTTVVEQASVQYELAYKDISTGNYENALKRVEYVISIYPEFPGAPELLRMILMQVEQPTATPTMGFIFTPTPMITSTPDLRSAEETFNTLQQNIVNQQWDLAIENVLSIRQINYEYRTVDVDGLYFIALRNRGIQKIQSGELEQGLYDLATAEQIGPLDGDADGVRSWAELYLTGASYWDVNWQQAIDIFYQVQAAYPYLMDSSGMTAIERYRVALYRFGDQFAASGDYCKAQEYYNLSLGVGSDPVIQATATYLGEACLNMERTPEDGGDTTPTPPATEPPPVEETPTPGETEEVTPTP